MLNVTVFLLKTVYCGDFALLGGFSWVKLILLNGICLEYLPFCMSEKGCLDWHFRPEEGRSVINYLAAETH